MCEAGEVWVSTGVGGGGILSWRGGGGEGLWGMRERAE